MKPVATCLAAALLLLGCGGDEPRAETGVSVEITAYPVTGDAPYCDALRVTEDVILAYFEAAQPATGGDYVDNLYSPCMVAGVLRTADGARDFVIKSSGVSRLHRDGEESTYLFAEPTWTDPFGGPYWNQD